MKPRSFLVLIFLVIISAFVFVFAYYWFYTLFIRTDFLSVKTTIGAFMGAFFAFLFIRLADILTRIYDRQVKHFNALIRLQHLLNDYLNQISDNIFVINGFRTSTDKYFTGKSAPVIYLDRFASFEINKDIPLDLHNLDLIMDLFSFNIDLDKMNKSMDVASRSNQEIKDAFVNKKIDENTYKTNLAIAEKKFGELEVFLRSLDDKAQRLLAIARILSEDEPLLTNVTNLIVPSHLSKKQNENIPVELERLKSEIAETKATSQQEISSTLNKD